MKSTAIVVPSPQPRWALPRCRLRKAMTDAARGASRRASSIAAPAGHGPGYRAVDDHRRGVEHRYVRDDRNDRHFNGHGRQFYRGGHIPNEYRGRQYVVNDWRGRHLHAPPRGQQWVQVGTDYALIAIATGVIAQLVLSN